MKSKLRRTKIKGGPEKLVLTGLIVSTDFISKVKPIYNKRSMSSKWAKTIAGWCLDYYNEFDKAPMEAIKDIYDCEHTKLDPEDAGLIKDHLHSLNDEFERSDLFNFQYALKQAQYFFRKKSLEKLNREISELVEGGDVDQAAELLMQYDCPSMDTEQTSTDILTDSTVLKKAFEQVGTPLIQFTGALGSFVNGMFVRKGFISIMAPEKRGKTWWLNEICLQALKCRCKVAYFNCGDMDNEEQSVRFSIRISGRNADEEYCGRFRVPVLDCIENQKDTCMLAKRKCDCGVIMETPEGETVLDYDEAPAAYSHCSECKGKKGFKGTNWFKEVRIATPLTWKQALKINKKFVKHSGTRDRFRMESYPNGTLSPAMIKARVHKWIREDGFLPDVIIADYADIMDSDGKGDFRQTENTKWKAMRSMCQVFNILFITATQSDAGSYDAEMITEKNFSEDKRKFSHVTGMITLNQSDEESEKGLMRLGKLMVRNGKKTRGLVTVLQSLRQGRPNIGSFYRH